MKNQKQGLAITALILGVISLVFSIVPIINNVSFFSGVIAVVFGIIALLTHNQERRNR